MRSVASLTAALIAAVMAVLAAPAAADARGGGRLDATERGIVRAINAERAAHGLPGVRPARRLSRAAHFHSSQMLAADFFAHTSRDGSPFDRRVRRFAKYRVVGETLARLPGCSRRSIGAIVGMWMQSPPHRAVLLEGRFRRVGIGKRTGRLGASRACVVTADFGAA